MANVAFCLFYGFSLNLPLQAVDKIYSQNLQHSPQVVAFSLNSHPSFKKEFFSNGVTTSTGSRPPHYRNFTITLGHTTIMRLPWVNDQTGAETSNGQHTTVTRDIHPCPRRDSNLQSHQASVHRPTPLGSAERMNTRKKWNPAFVLLIFITVCLLLLQMLSFPSTNHYFGPDNASGYSNGLC